MTLSLYLNTLAGNAISKIARSQVTKKFSSYTNLKMLTKLCQLKLTDKFKHLTKVRTNKQMN